MKEKKSCPWGKDRFWASARASGGDILEGVFGDRECISSREWYYFPIMFIMPYPASD